MENNSEERELLKALDEQSRGMKVQDILEFLWRLKWFILLSVAVLSASAYVYVKIQTPQYTAKAKVMFIDNQNSSSEASLVEELTRRRQNGRKNDEIIVIKSPSLMENVVNKLGLNVRYFQYRLPLFHSSFPLFRDKLNIKFYEYYGDAPFSLKLDVDQYLPESKLPKHIKIKFEHSGNMEYRLVSVSIDGEVTDYKQRNVKYRYGTKVRFPSMSFVLKDPDTYAMIEGDTYQADWYSPHTLAEYFSSNLSASLESAANSSLTNVLLLSIVDNSPERARDILEVLVSEYNLDARQYKSQSLVNSVKFIDDRLEELSQELTLLETSYTGRSQVLEYEANKGSVTTAFDFEQQLTDLNLQTTLLDMFKTEVYNQEKTGEYEMLPANMGITDGALDQAVLAYNELVGERNRLRSNSANNPRILQYNEQISEALTNIKSSIHTLEVVMQVREKELTRRLNDSRSVRNSIPTRQIGISEMARRQQIIEPLYLQLNQKREELQLMMLSISDNVRVIEPALPNYSPISPNSKKIMRMAVLFGLMLPILVVLSRKWLRRKVETKEDIKHRLEKPVLATIPKGISGLVDFEKEGRSSQAESFRMLRSNLNYMEGKVIHVTSSITGEGKSYVAANLALTIAQTRRKIALVGLDLRKPAITRMFGDLHDHGSSIVRYLLGKCEIGSLPCKYVSNDIELDLFYPGAIPPNPSELLSLPRFGEMMSYLRANYDYVVLDSAPYFPVTDSSIVNKFADITLYVIRADYTELRMVDELAELFESGRLKNVGIALNGVDVKSRKYYYGYGYGNYYGYGYGRYGYGYGHYGYGYGYGGESEGKKHRKRNGWLRQKSDKNDGVQES